MTNVDPKYKSFYDSLKATLELKADEWATNPNFGAMNFLGVMKEIKNIKSIVAALQQVDASLLPANRLGSIVQTLQGARQNLSKMQSFTLTDPNAQTLQKQISSSITTSYQTLFDQVHSLIPYFFAQDQFIAASEKIDHQLATANDQLKAQAEAANNNSSEIIKKLENMKVEAETTLSAIKTAAGQAGVSKEATHFAVEAEEYKEAARKWAAATIAVACAAVVWGAVVLWWIPVTSAADTAELVQHTVGKIIVFTGLYYALVWCARNYSASKHNYVVNKHKQNSLSTFESFVKAADQDVSVKNAVLLQATTSIFASQVSGYAKQESEPESPNKIIELVRSVSDKSAH